MARPDDVVVREARNSPSVVYLLGTLSSPDQFRCRDRDEALSWATRFAQHEHIEAWLQTLDGDLVSLGSFRQPVPRSIAAREDKQRLAT